MTYAEAKDKVFATASRPEGYNGDRITVELSFDKVSGKTLEVHSMGFHLSPVVPPAVDTSEALWLIEHHPACTRFYSDVKMTDWINVQYN